MLVGSALKNVLAIATGVVKGLGYGPNTQMALVTRGWADIRHLARSYGPPTVPIVATSVCVCMCLCVCVCVYGEKGVEVGFLMVTVVMACAEGAREETMTGLAGIGDVMLTCFGGPDTPRLLVWRVSSRGITSGCHCQA